MKINKYKISIERDLLRCNLNNKVVASGYPKEFGEKENNNFIQTEKDKEYILRINTPAQDSIWSAYDKFTEITNVVIEELYKLDERIWPVSTYTRKSGNINLYGEISLSIDEDFIVDLKKEFRLPKTMEDIYKLIKDNLTKKVDMISGLYGNIKVKSSKKGITIYNIRLNYQEKNGLSISDVKLLVGMIFGSLIENKLTADNLKDELKRLVKLDKKYNLKIADGIENIQTELKNKKSRIEREESLSEKEILALLEKYNEEGHYARYCLQNYPKLVAESVANIKDALARGIDYEVLNEQKSIVEFNVKGHKEFVIEGNKTDRDNYIFPIITDDKYTSKQIMLSNGLNCPQAILLDKDMNKDDIDILVSPFYNKKVVIKPRNTNYGTGITVFSKAATKAQIMKAIEYAFKFDNCLLVEEYAKGMEYRFLVIDGKCLSVAHRRTASVVGDGKSTIKQLIEKKNKEPWHALTGSPVKVDEPVVEYLKLQGLTFDSVIPDGKRIFLRTNSNVSTGGESIDYTYTMPAKFKKIAEKASRAFDAKICGVDIIIEDFKKDNYSIIEINDNPGYSINEWPYEGKGEKIGISVLELLNLLPKKALAHK